MDFLRRPGSLSQCFLVKLRGDKQNIGDVVDKSYKQITHYNLLFLYKTFLFPGSLLWLRGGAATGMFGIVEKAAGTGVHGRHEHKTGRIDATREMVTDLSSRGWFFGILPTTLYILVVSMALGRTMGDIISERRRASMVLPDPGGPTINKL